MYIYQLYALLQLLLVDCIISLEFLELTKGNTNYNSRGVAFYQFRKPKINRKWKKKTTKLTCWCQKVDRREEKQNHLKTLVEHVEERNDNIKML